MNWVCHSTSETTLFTIILYNGRMNWGMLQKAQPYHLISHFSNTNITRTVVLFTEWTLTAQTVNQTVRESYGTKSLYHF